MINALLDAQKALNEKALPTKDRLYADENGKVHAIKRNQDTHKTGKHHGTA